MSRLAKKPVKIPEGVSAEISEDKIIVKGPKGELSIELNEKIKAEVTDEGIVFSKKEESKQALENLGTSVRLVENMLNGVKEGYEKQLELEGVGFRMSVQGKKISMALGFSHPVEVDVPDGIEVKIEENVLTVSGIDKQKVGQFAAEIRSLRPAEPYKGKGFHYVGEIIRRKEGKKAVATETA